MKIKIPNIEFINFNEGICDIYSKEDNTKIEKFNSLGFQNRVFGFNRFFSAAANQVKINKVIRIPDVKGIDSYDNVEIENVVYDIKIIQPIHDTNPRCIELTLQKV